MKTVFQGKSYFTNVPCKYLDTATKCSKSYENRYIRPDGCVPFDVALGSGCFPDDCPYVIDIPNYVGPEPYRKLVKILRKLKILS